MYVYIDFSITEGIKYVGVDLILKFIRRSHH